MAKKMDEAKNMQTAMEAVDAVMEQAAADTGAAVAHPSEGVAPTEETMSAEGTVPMEEAVPVAAEADTSGFYIYIGPNIKGLIQTGTIYRGDRANALQAAKDAIEKHPKVKSLIVSGDALPGARLKVKTPGNVLYANYAALKKDAAGK